MRSGSPRGLVLRLKLPGRSCRRGFVHWGYSKTQEVQKVKTTYEIYRVGEPEPERHEIDWPRAPGYDAIRGLVEPLLDERGRGREPLEHITVLHEGWGRDMFVSEYGRVALTWREPLPVNEAATRIYRNNRLTQHPDTDPETLPTIAGTAVLFTNRIVWN